MTVASTLYLAEDHNQTPETLRHSRRLESLRDELRRANRRAAAPFSHPLAIRGSLSKLSEQIRDVSRVADAIMLNAETANSQRLNELCGDMKRLLQTQHRWTDRLENQIWRLESQASFMRRLQQLLRDRSPGNERLWELCDIIARETQMLPTGLLLLPEPGHGISYSNNDMVSRASWSLEQARLAVFSAVTLLPDVRGADIVARTLHASAAHLLQFAERDFDGSVFAEPTWMQRSAISGVNNELSCLIDQAGQVLLTANSLSLASADMIAPPMIDEFYGGLATAFPSDVDSSTDKDLAMAHAICQSLGLNMTSRADDAGSAIVDDAAVVLSHKLRWHDGTSNEGAQPATRSRSPIRRPHFAASGGRPATALTLFAREE